MRRFQGTRRPSIRLLVLGLLVGCAPALPTGPNGPTPPPAYTTRKVPNTDARVERVDGVRVLFTRGTPYQAGYHHGLLLQDAIALRLREIRTLAWRTLPGAQWIQSAQASDLERALNESEREELKGLARGARISWHEALLLQCDLPHARAGAWLNSAWGEARLLSGVGGGFVATGRATASGSTIVARTTAGPGDMGAPMLWVHHPESGAASLMLIEPGSPLVAWLGWSERGHTVHADPGTARWALGGVPAGLATRRLLRAPDPVRRSPLPGDGGTVALVAKVGQAVSVTSQGGRRALGEAPDLADTLHVASRFEDGLRSKRLERFDTRLSQLLRAYYGKITPAIAQEMIVDPYDPISGRRKAADGTLAWNGPAWSWRLGPFKIGRWAGLRTRAATVLELDTGLMHLSLGLEAPFKQVDVWKLLDPRREAPGSLGSQGPDPKLVGDWTPPTPKPATPAPASPPPAAPDWSEPPPALLTPPPVP